MQTEKKFNMANKTYFQSYGLALYLRSYLRLSLKESIVKGLNPAGVNDLRGERLNDGGNVMVSTCTELLRGWLNVIELG